MILATLIKTDAMISEQVHQVTFRILYHLYFAGSQITAG